MKSPDRYVGGAHAQHYMTQSAGNHDAIVRLREENTGLTAHSHKLEAFLRDALDMLAQVDDFTREDRWRLINRVTQEGWVER